MAEAEAADSSRAAEVPSTDNKASSNGRMPEPNATPSDQDHGEEEAIVLSNGEASKPIANGNVDSADKARETGSNAKGSVEGGASGDDGEHEDDKSDDDPFAGLDDVASMDIYDLSNYTFGKKNEEAKSKAMRDMHPAEIARSLQRNYEQRGMRRSVGAVLLVHAHNFPHILLLQRTDGKGEYSLPGGRLLAGESDEEGLRRKLDSKLKPSEGAPAEEQEIEIGEKSTIPSIQSSALKPFTCALVRCYHLLRTMSF